MPCKKRAGNLNIVRVRIDQPRAAIIVPAMDQSQAATSDLAMDQARTATSEYQKRKVGDQHNKYIQKM